MKILYGVQATGNGHISRSREMVKALKNMGDEVHVIFSGRDPEDLWDITAFEPYTVLKGFTFVTKGGRIRYFSTARGLNLFSFYSDIRGFNAESYNLAITDFEPVTARIAKRWSIPCIGIGHQYAFQYNIPISSKDIMALAVLKYFAPVAFPIGLHWHHFNCGILPPIVPSIELSEESVERKKILVYLPFEDLNEVVSLAEKFRDEQFYIYAGVESPSDIGNMHIRPFSRQGFLDDLITSEGVISNAGFELASESIHMGKRLLVKPLKGQLEQESNALALHKLKLGEVMQSLDRDIVKKWLNIERPAPIRYPDVAGMIAEWIGYGKWDNRSELISRAWAEVKMRIA